MAPFSFVPSLPSSPDAFIPPADAASAGASRAPLIIGVSLFCLLVLTVVTALRLYTRRFLLRTFGFDDYLVMAAWLTVVAVGVLYIVHTQYGLGSHIWEVTGPEDLLTSLKFIFAENVVYNASLMVIKASLFAQYYRLVAQTSHRSPCLVLALLVMAWCLGTVLTIIFGCIPVQAAWDFTITDRDCTAASRGIIIGIGNVVTDFIIILLPVPVIWRLEMQRGQRLAVVGIFAIGALACVVSILRLAFGSITDDFSYSAVLIDCWTIGELSAACCCPSLMVLQPFMKTFGFYPGRSLHGGSHKRLDEPSRSRPSSRRTASRRCVPENLHGSEVELCSVDVPHGTMIETRLAR